MKSTSIFEYNSATIPRFTIAIPTYNRVETLKETILCAISQIDYYDYDVLVVDNNPKRNDLTENLMWNYSNSIVSYYKNEDNLGMVGNWNQLYTLAKGNYVVLLHDDDLISLNFLFVMNQIIELESKGSVFFPPFRSFYSISDLKIGKINFSNFKGLTLDSVDFLNGNVVGPPVGMIVKRNVMLSTRGFRNDFYPSIDYDFYVQNCGILGFLKIYGDPLAFYRIDNNESLKEESILSFVKVDLKIKWSIVEKLRLTHFGFFFNCYFKIFSINYFRMITKLFRKELFFDKIVNSGFFDKTKFYDYLFFYLIQGLLILFLFVRKFKINIREQRFNG